MKNKKLSYKIHILIVVMILSLFVSLLPDITAYAAETRIYHSWMREGEDEVYSDVGTPIDNSTYETYVPRDDSVVKHLVNLVNTGSYSVDQWLNKLATPNYSITLSGIVMGKLADYRVSILKFELFEDNPWGVVGSQVYVVFRNVIYGMMFLYCAILFVKQLFNNGAKGRAELKSTCSTVIFMFSLLYIMPWVVNMFIIIRDSIILTLGESMLGARGLDIHESVSAVMHMSEEVDLFLAVIYFALIVAPIFYVVGYASIAMQETGLFGLFPVVALLSIRDKKMLNSWCGMFFSNLAVPLLDYLFLLIPIVLKALIDPTAGENIAYAVVTLCCIWSAQPARNAILRLFGNMGGAQANIGGMAALGMAAMRMMGGGAKGGSGLAGASSSITDDLTNAQRFENLAGGFNEALADTQREIGTIATVDDVLSGNVDENGMFMASLAEGATESVPSAVDTSDIELNAGGGSVEGEATLAADHVQDVTGEPMTESELIAEAENGVMSNGIPGEDTSELPKEDGVFYSRGEVPAEELSQREVFQNARLDNLEKLDAAKEALNDQQAIVNAAEQDYASVAGDVAAKETALENNNTRLDKISEQLAEDEAHVSKYDSQAQKYPSMSPAEKQSFDAEFGDIEERRARIGNLTNEQAVLTAQNAKLTNEIAAIKSNPEYTKAADALTEAKGRQTALSKVIQKRTDAEQSFASMMESQGGDGKTYDNALSYGNAIKLKNIRNQQTSWRNFDAHADTSDITPDEKAGYLRQRAEHKQTQAAVRTVAKVAGGFAGAVAGIYGGAGAMATGAMLGAGGTEKLANAGMEHYNDRKDLKQAKDAGQVDVPNKYEQYVRNRKEGKKTQPQKQTVTNPQTKTVTPSEGIANFINEEVSTNASKDGFTIKDKK